MPEFNVFMYCVIIFLIPEKVHGGGPRHPDREGEREVNTQCVITSSPDGSLGSHGLGRPCSGSDCKERIKKDIIPVPIKGKCIISLLRDLPKFPTRENTYSYISR